MILKLEYTQAELKKLEGLYEKYYSLPDHNFAKKEVVDTWAAITEITDRVENKALEYYKKHLDELVIDIQDEFKFAMDCVSEGNPDYKFSDNWLKFAKWNIRNFINLLDLIDDNAKQQALKQIDLAYKNRKNIIGSPEVEELNKAAEKGRKALKENPVLPSEYLYMRQNVAIKKFAEVSIKGLKVQPENDILTIKDGDFTVSIYDYSSLAGFKTSTKKLLDELIMCFTNGQSERDFVELPLREHMKLRGLKDIKETREQVKNDLKTLSHTELTFDLIINGKNEHYGRIGIIGDHDIKNGVILAHFEPKFRKSLLVYGALLIPKPILGLNDNNNPHSYNLGRRIAFHKALNYRKSNSDVISVATLINSCPTLTKHKEVCKSGNYSYTQKIIEPFERDMNALDEVFSWEYCHSKGIALSDNELQNFNYKIFSKLYIKISWRNYPEIPKAEIKKLKNIKKKKLN